MVPAALWIRRGVPPQMPHPHRHDDIEINVVLQGRLDYIFGGSRLAVPAGRLAVFWAATPHRLFFPPGVDPADTRGCWLHLPLGTVLSWGLGEQQIRRLLHPSALTAPLDGLVHDPEPMFATWEQELRDPATTAPTLLEAQALLRRVLGHGAAIAADSISGDGGARQGAVIDRVIRMARFIVEHFAEPITLADIADAAHLNRSYAATIFSRTLGSTPGQYLSRRRIAEAQRLLITTDRTMIDIAHASGFNSQSNFYEQFTRRCGVAPGDYRRGLGRD